MTILESIAGSATGALVKSALKKKGSHGTPKKRGAGHRAAKTEDRIAKALTDLRRSSSEDPALADFREDLFSEHAQAHPSGHRPGQEGQTRPAPHPHALQPITARGDREAPVSIILLETATHSAIEGLGVVTAAEPQHNPSRS